MIICIRQVGILDLGTNFIADYDGDQGTAGIGLR